MPDAPFCLLEGCDRPAYRRQRPCATPGGGIVPGGLLPVTLYL
jgi:hypothetical protein